MINRLLIPVLFFVGSYIPKEQIVRPYPIPSFNIVVNGYADFEENNSQPGNSRGKRFIHASTRATGKTLCSATILFYSLDTLDYFGPFNCDCGQTIDQEIDQREWGALVQSDMEVTVDVWITEE